MLDAPVYVAFSFLILDLGTVNAAIFLSLYPPFVQILATKKWQQQSRDIEIYVIYYLSNSFQNRDRSGYLEVVSNSAHEVICEA